MYFYHIHFSSHTHPLHPRLLTHPILNFLLLCSFNLTEFGVLPNRPWEEGLLWCLVSLPEGTSLTKTESPSPNGSQFWELLS